MRPGASSTSLVYLSLDGIISWQAAPQTEHVADYLVAKGMPFREAHGVTYELTNHAASQGKKLNEVPLKTYQEFSNLFDSDILSITAESSIRARNVPGGTSHEQVSKSLVAARQSLENDIAG